MKDGSIKEIVSATSLWNHNDEQKFSDLYAEFNYGTKHFTIVACKGSFVHVFILNSKGKLIRTMSQHVPNLFITGKCVERRIKAHEIIKEFQIEISSHRLP